MWSRMSVLVLALGGAPVAAQEAPSAGVPTVEGYLCVFAGKCDGAGDGPQATRDAPRTKGFRLARPAADPRPAPAPVVRPARHVAAPRASISDAALTARANGGAGTPSRSYTPPATAAAPGARRADLLIGFELNSAQLSSQGTYAAQVFAKSLLTPELKNMRFRIEGHTDIRGGRAINDALSRRRAQAVADYLVVLGVDRARLDPRGYGATAPLPGHRVTDPANRRVEAELIS